MTVSVQGDTNPKSDEVHYSVANHEYGGAACLRDVYTNKGTGFTEEERDRLGLQGLLPTSVQTMDEQLTRVGLQIDARRTPFEKYISLRNLRQRNERLFYAYLMKHKRSALPLVYTPIVGEACQKFSAAWRRPEGLTLSLNNKGRMAECVANWPRSEDTPRIAVVTDGSRILGLGDLGWNGLGICIGKLSLYVLGAGVHPQGTIPIVIDVGTNTDEIRDDPMYLGLRRQRPNTDELVEFVDEAMEALNAKYPNLIIQFEDWSSEHAFLFLERYQKKYPMFNDDIQGTGAVILAGFINAARISAAAADKGVEDQRILMVGSGSAAIGVAKQLMSFFMIHGMSEEEARSRIWTTDTRGLVTKNRGDKLPAHKQFFARSDNGSDQFKNLEDIVDYVKPTVIFGLSTVPGTFNATVLRKMAELNKQPIIFPLSNPTTNSECTFQEALDHTDGRAIFAAGSPFDNIEFHGKTRFADQGNNFYIFPGVGLAGALTKAKRITDNVITESALALADSMTQQETDEGRVYPVLERVREISNDVAHRCIRVINKENLARDDGFTAKLNDDELRKWINEQMWVPSYDH
ncbi:malate dehydrogenase (oxaloacetate-decarboxylating) (NADP(+)) [Malassezia sp. CBS 17886]|nr:malate dehydrogenase (oxaloacetate-decarboxylating) (NADP(+)) [Malassezia sp. CBS 17886]